MWEHREVGERAETAAKGGDLGSHVHIYSQLQYENLLLTPSTVHIR